MERKRAIVIGSGIGGLAMAIRLQALGFDTTVLERLDGPGGRASVRRDQGFVQLNPIDHRAGRIVRAHVATQSAGDAQQAVQTDALAIR